MRPSGETRMGVQTKGDAYSSSDPRILSAEREGAGCQFNDGPVGRDAYSGGCRKYHWAIWGAPGSTMTPCT